MYAVNYKGMGINGIRNGLDFGQDIIGPLCAIIMHLFVVKQVKVKLPKDL